MQDDPLQVGWWAGSAGSAAPAPEVLFDFVGEPYGPEFEARLTEELLAIRGEQQAKKLKQMPQPPQPVTHADYRSLVAEEKQLAEVS